MRSTSINVEWSRCATWTKQKLNKRIHPIFAVFFLVIYIWRATKILTIFIIVIDDDQDVDAEVHFGNLNV